MRFVPVAYLLAYFFVCATLPALAQTAETAKPATRYATPADIPVAAFFRREQYAQMAISPDGKKLAALRPTNGRDNLVVIDFLAGKTQVITSYKESDVIDFEWISNDRLYFRIADQSVVSGSRFLKGAYAIDVDGQYLRDLTYPLERAADKAARQNSFSERGVNVSFRVLSRTFDGSGDVIAEIFGRSYGGYATLQGLAKDADLWRCGAAFVAVTDLETFQTASWSDIARGSGYLETDFKRQVGDKDRDREQFLKTSPAKNADQIKAAVLLAMGHDDKRVPRWSTWSTPAKDTASTRKKT